MISKNTEQATPSIQDHGESETRADKWELPPAEDYSCEENPDALMPADELTICDDEPTEVVVDCQFR